MPPPRRSTNSLISSCCAGFKYGASTLPRISPSNSNSSSHLGGEAVLQIRVRILIAEPGGRSCSAWCAEW